MGRATKAAGKRSSAHRLDWGSIRALRSGRFQARYTGPDGSTYTGPITYTSETNAKAFLRSTRTDIERGQWQPKATKPVTVGEFASEWISGRDLKPRTRSHYRSLSVHLAPFADTAMVDVTPTMVRQWHSTLLVDRPTLRSHAYSLLKAIMATAVAEEVRQDNPCRVVGAGSSKRVHKIKPASVAELEAIAKAMPPKYRAMLLLSSWCGLRFGEVTELRRKDIDLADGVIRVRRAVVRADGQVIVGTPKSAAGIRDVSIPPHLIPLLRAHVADHAAWGKDGLLFPATQAGEHIAPASLYRVYYPARRTAGREDLRWHDLRHTGAVLAAATGATLAELMARLGHSTPAAAMRYQHASQDADKVIAERLSALAQQ